MSRSEVIIEELTAYSQADAADLGRLMVHLTDRASGDPVQEDLLQRMIDSPEHGLLVARFSEGERRFVGAAALSVVMGPMAGREGYLQDFVTDPDVRGQGIGNELWRGMLDWCRAREVSSLMFTSRSSREAAHRFYLSRGAEIRDTTPFRVPIGEAD